MAAEKALTFDSPGPLWPRAPGKPVEAPGVLKESCARHVLEVHAAWLPPKENKVMRLENEASVLDFRSGICILFRGQNVRSHHSFGVIFLICTEKKSYPALIFVHPFC